jgi:hypothetical protein
VFTNLFPPGAGLAVTSVTLTPDLIGIAAASMRTAADCPACRCPSDRIQSHYVRTVADLPWQGRRVVLRLTVRWFRCQTAGCSRSVFCERLSAVLTPHARSTDRLTDAHRLIGLALGGEAGARLCDGLTGGSVKVWLILFRDAKAATGTARTGQADIARRAGMSRRGVQVALDKLTANGLVTLVRRGRLNAGPSAYRVHPISNV